MELRPHQAYVLQYGIISEKNHLGSVSQAHHGVYEETHKDRKEKPNGNDWAATGRG
jgi:hypothetical protein